MSHEIPKLLLSHTVSPAELDAAIKRAIELGMPLHEVEEFLDWLDVNRPQDPGRFPQAENGPRDMNP